MRKNLIFIPIIFAILSLAFIMFIYFTSARFLDTPNITLPDDSHIEQSSVSYDNKYIYEDIVINELNYKEVLLSLARPKVYSYITANTLFYNDIETVTTTYAKIDGEEITAIRDNVTYIALLDNIIIQSGGEEKIVSRTLYTDDELIGIPTFEDLIALENAVLVEFSSDTYDILSVRFHNEELGFDEIYYVSLSSGVLLKYEIYNGETLFRRVEISNLVIDE